MYLSTLIYTCIQSVSKYWMASVATFVFSSHKLVQCGRKRTDPVSWKPLTPGWGGLFRVCLPNVLRNHPKRWEVARGDGFGPSATKWFFLQQAATRLVPWLFTTSLGAPNSRV